MIFFSPPKGLVKAEDWEDVVSRAGMMTDRDRTDHELLSISACHIFGDKIQCNVSNCHTFHSMGGQTDVHPDKSFAIYDDASSRSWVFNEFMPTAATMVVA